MFIAQANAYRPSVRHLPHNLEEVELLPSQLVVRGQHRKGRAWHGMGAGSERSSAAAPRRSMVQQVTPALRGYELELQAASDRLRVAASGCK